MYLASTCGCREGFSAGGRVTLKKRLRGPIFPVSFPIASSPPIVSGARVARGGRPGARSPPPSSPLLAAGTAARRRTTRRRTFQSATVNGTTMVVTFDETLDSTVDLYAPSFQMRFSDGGRLPISATRRCDFPAAP